MASKERRGGCLSPLLTWGVAAGALWITAYLLPGLHVAKFYPDALIAALVIGLVNALVRPVVVMLTLPATVLTLGLFLLVINGLMLQLADYLLAGFHVQGFLWAVAGSVVLSAVTSVLNGIFLTKKSKD